MMKKTFFFAFLLSSLGMMATETLTYRLQQVTSVKNGEKYVFVQGGRAMDAAIDKNGAVQTTDQYLSSGLTGDESYVWTLKKTGDYFFMIDTYGLYLSQKTGSSLEQKVGGGTQWTFTLQSNNTMVVSTTTSSSIYTLCYSSTTSYVYKLYQYITESSSANPHNLEVYQLVPDNYSRDIAAEKVGSLGTICLPYRVSAPSGADFYQVAYKTVDAQNHPLELFYEQVSGSLEAGHPYLFVSTSTQLQLPADTDAPQASAPVVVNGFHGTFKDIQDESTSNNTNVLENNYIIYNNQIQLCGVGCGLSPYRAYIKMDDVPLQTSVAAPTRQVVVLSQKGQPQFINPSQSTPTDLSSQMAADAAPAKIIRNGQVLILREGQLYNLFGTKQ